MDLYFMVHSTESDAARSLGSQVRQMRRLSRRTVELENELARQCAARIVDAPGDFGFPSIAAFLAVYKRATGGKQRVPLSLLRQMRPRSKLDARVREQVKTLLGRGFTAKAVAKIMGIGLPSVYLLSKVLGVRPGKRKLVESDLGAPFPTSPRSRP